MINLPSSSIVAAWVQAVGSVLAIIAAIWISRREVVNQQKQAALSVRVFADNLVGCLDSLIYALKEDRLGDAKQTQHRLSELVEFSRSLRFDLLKPGQMWTAFDLRAIAVQALRAQSDDSLGAFRAEVYQKLMDEARQMAKAYKDGMMV